MNYHHYQRVDLENGYLEATRDDTDELQDLWVKAHARDGTPVFKTQIVYNIHYDYYRRREWNAGVLTYDGIITGHAYGHLQFEFDELENTPEDWFNSYPDNYEPVKPEGADIFHREGVGLGLMIFLNDYQLFADVNFYIWDDLHAGYKTGMNLLTDVSIESHQQTTRDKWDLRLRGIYMKMFYHIERWKRKQNLGWQSKEIGVDIPIDSRFID